MEPFRYWMEHELVERLAAEPEPGMPAPATVVSVDYDFFVPEPDLGAVPEETAELLVAGVRWLLEEWFSRERALAAWEEHYDRILVVGGDADELVRADPSCPLDRFAASLAGRFRFVEAFVADSHVWGSYVLARGAQRAGRRVELVSFDAHHDCGYRNLDSLARSRRRARERPSCDDWVQYGLAHDGVEHAAIVYPDWRAGRRRENAPPTVRPKDAARVTLTNWSSWSAGRPRRRVDATLLLVRSSAYVPPWLDHDERFLELAASLASAAPRCLDCDPPLGVRVGDQDACTPRLFPRRAPE